jgi:glutathione-regulated potassium-efflux system ancillary protein KefC
MQAAVYFAAAVIAVMLSHRLGLGSVAGYLLAGIAIGPWGFKLVGQIEDVRAFAELGVVFLLFVIGLELEPRRLWSMRVKLVGLGASQVLGSIALIMLVGWALGVDPRATLVVAMALSLSSTALALQPLTERSALGTQGGQATFAILLFQDIAVIPMLAVIPLLGGGAAATFSWQGLGFAVGAIVATLVLGHFLARPVFRHIARTRLREIFTAFALLLVLGIAIVFEHVGLSMALGAFLAGVLLAESEYRHEIEAAIEPFKGLLLGLFFISVGMTVDFTLLFTRPLVIIGLIAGLFILKGVVLLVIARVAGMPRHERPLFIMLVSQGGEFAFVLLGVAAARSVVDAETAQAITLAVALSMLQTPLMLVLHDRVLLPRFSRDQEKPPADTPEQARVIVAGLGRVGQVVARLLNAADIHPTVLDDDPDHVEQSRKFGFRVFYGDATRLDLLHAAGADHADFLIITIEDPAAITHLAKICKANFPNLRLIARARDMRHSFELRDLGVEIIERETWLSALKLGETALSLIGGDADRARRVATAFAEHDEEVQAKLYAVHKESSEARISVSNELREQLARTLSEDERSNISKR